MKNGTRLAKPIRRVVWTLLLLLLLASYCFREQASDSVVGIVGRIKRIWACCGSGINPLTEEEQSHAALWRSLSSNARSPRKQHRMFASKVSVYVDAVRPNLEALVIENTTGATKSNFWFYKQGMPNFYNARTLVDSVTNGEKTQTEKVLALVNLFPRFHYNDWSIKPISMPNDPTIHLAVLGTGRGFHASNTLQTLCQMIGCRTREIKISLDHGLDHPAVEIYADGKWIIAEPDNFLIFPKANGGYASAEDLMKNPDLIRRVNGTRLDWRTHNSKRKNFETLAKAYGEVPVKIGEVDEDLNLAQQQLNPKKFSRYNHVMRFDLLPHGRVMFFPKKSGKLSKSMQHVERPFYANGIIEYMFDAMSLKSFTKTNNGVLVPITSPYLLVGGNITGYTDGKGRVDFLPLLKARSAAGWNPIWSGKGAFRVDITDLVNKQAMFGYVLRLSNSVQKIKISSDFQFPPRSIPYLDSGKNEFIWYGEKKAVVFRVTDFLSHTGILTLNVGTRASNGYGIRVTFRYQGNPGNRRINEIRGNR